MKLEISEDALKHLKRRAIALQVQNVPLSRREGQVIEDVLRSLGLWQTRKEKP